jgi:hypothetical protein
MTHSRTWPLGAALVLLGALAWPGASRPEAIAQDLDKPAVARPRPVAPAPEAPVAPAPQPAPAKKDAAPVSAPPAKANSEATAPEDAETTEGGIPPSMAALFPIGRVFEGVRIPSYSGDSLGSVIHSQYMKRSDDEHLEMEMLEIVIYNAGKADTRILTDRAIFDTVAKTLRSTTPAKIVQDQFEMRGDRLIFDSNSRTGHLSGNVKTLIFNSEQFRNKKGGPQ